MSYGIEIFGDGIRNPERTRYGVCGVCVDSEHRRFIWNDNRAARFSGNKDQRISLSTIWRYVMERAQDEMLDVRAKLPDLEVDPFQALGQLIRVTVQDDKVSKGHVVLAVDNSTTELTQERIITAASHAGVAPFSLLWRPVAACLYLLSQKQETPKVGDKLIFVDMDSLRPEITMLTVKKWENTQSLVPQRRRFQWENILLDDQFAFKAKQSILEVMAKATQSGSNQWETGFFAEDFGSFIETCQPKGSWCLNGLAYTWHPFDATITDQALRQQGVEGNIHSIIQRVSDKAKNPNDRIYWTGWLAHRYKSLLPKSHVVLPPDAIVKGCSIYGECRDKDGPTYYDSLPGLYILSKIQELATYAFFTLVDPEISVPGGRGWRLPAPLSRFSVDENISMFTAYIKRDDWDKCRKATIPLPAPAPDIIPVNVHCAMKPAQGRAVVSIESQDQQSMVFGEIKQLILNWDKMEETDFELFVAPKVYPVIGRLKGDEEYANIVRHFLDSNMSFSDIVNYRGHNVQFWKLMEPWGTNPPWGFTPHWHSEPVRGMFGIGSDYLKQEDCHAIIGRIQNLPNQPNADSIKFFNYLFDAVPESFMARMRNMLSENTPDFRAWCLTQFGNWHLFNSWNWGYTPGRVIKTADDFNLFMDFMIRHSANNGYPCYPEATFTHLYFWSFFRCLCYRADVIKADSKKALEVIRMLDKYARAGLLLGGGHQIQNARKFVLCAFLFALRYRSANAAFLQPGSGELYNSIDDCIEHVVPVVNAVGIIPGDLGIANLNAFVLKFLRQTATKADMAALEGLVTSMS